MPDFIRHTAIALSVLCLTASATALSTGSALAQAKGGQMAPQAAAPPAQQQPQLKQIPLTDKQIQGVLAAAKEMDALQEKMPQDGKPDAKLIAQLESTVKKYGFASFDDYSTVIDNIGLIMSGIDPTSKKYVGNAAVTRAQIAEIQADKKMSAKDKKEALDDLNQALKMPDPTIENKGNIDLVLKNYDKLDAIMGEDDKN